MDIGIQHKHALVLASSRGLGRGVATALAAEGAKVTLVGRDQAILQSVVDGISNEGGQALYIVADLTQTNVAQTIYDQALAGFGQIDILVNNTGGPPPGPTTAFSGDQWRSYFQTMFVSLVELTNLCLPAMQQAQWGRIITLASSGIQQPIDNLAMSNSLRSALVGWSKSLANEVGEYGITANILAPGRIYTDRLDQLDVATSKQLGITKAQARAANERLIPIGRYGRVEEFAAVAVFLASAAASYVTGNVIRCDGGATKGV